MNRRTAPADICLILEGTYPYITGGVSQWAHDLILALKDFKFHLVAIVPSGADLVSRYELPENVVGVSNLVLQDLPPGRSRIRHTKKFFEDLTEPLSRVHSRGNLSDLAHLIDAFAPYKKQLGFKILLDSREAWKILLQMYESEYSGNSFLDYFWSWRIIMSGFFSLLFTPIPPAGIYHATSTGFAGLLLARAKLETQKPALLTEHGIYTNERRVEISMAQWLYEQPFARLSIKKLKKDLKDLWINLFINYSRICYEACDKIITLFPGNQNFQKDDDANPEKLTVIPNGVNFDELSQIKRKKSDRPTIALIGRVVPIKDIKTYIRACAILKERFPDLLAYIIGPTDEDESYFQECQELTHHLNLKNTLTFTGKVKLEPFLEKIDVNVLTSISEAQPLVLLEVGAVGIPSVATDVGSCSELIFGNELENPALGPGGDITSLSNPVSTANAVFKLLTDRTWYHQCSQTCRERVRLYYNKENLIKTYKALYQGYLLENRNLKAVGT
ncbi:MAG: GT4 family glycosyltransferase PelF [Nitrospinaceae bacterium]